jgi:hypothetical protein
MTILINSSTVSLNECQYRRWKQIIATFTYMLSFTIIFDGTAVVKTASVVLWSELRATDPRGPGSIPGATRFYEK